jgi:hypothetical protein
MSKYEATHWRDEKISEWHRKIGRDAPAVDLDTIVSTSDLVVDGYNFDMVEYDNMEPVAIIDYKAGDNWKFNANILVQAKLATRAGLPSFVVEYNEDQTQFTVYPTNEIGKKKLNTNATLSEKQFVKFLYWLRGREVPGEVLARLR